MSKNSSSNKSTRLGCGLLLLIISVVFWLIALVDGSIGLGSSIFLSIMTITSILLMIVGKRKIGRIVNIRGESKYEIKQREAGKEKLLCELKSGNIDKLKVAGMHSKVIMQKNEEMMLMLPEVDLIEYISRGEIKGGSGISVMGYGLTGGIHSEQKEEKRVLDNGVLVITNTRVVFDGGKRSSETIHSDILAVEPYSNGIAVKSRARDVVQYYTITNPERCTLKFTYEERTYEETINGEWLASIIEGAIRSGEKYQEENKK